MKTKEKNIMKWCASIVVVAVVVVGILLGTYLNKDAEAELVVTAQNIEVTEGEIKQVEYSSSIKDAQIRMRIADSSIAELKTEGVLGKVVGETELIITARHNNLVYEKRIKVLVNKKTDDVNNGENKPGDNTGTDKEEEKPETPEQEVELKLTGHGCNINGKTIEIEKGKTARVTVCSEEDFTVFEIEKITENLSVKESEFSQRLYEIKSDIEGEYEIRFKLDDKYAIIKVKIKA